MNTEKMLAECRAQWEASSGGSVFADYWLGWKAGREALVIELPQRWDDRHGGMRKEPDGIWLYHRQAVAAIEAAGVKVAK